MTARFELVGPMSPDDLIARCEATGIRMGPARRQIMQAVARSTGPFDFEAIWSQLGRGEQRISRGSVYLSLRRLCRAGLIRPALEDPAAEISRRL